MARLVCSSPHLTALATLHLSPSRLPLSQSSLALTAETLAGYAFLSVLSAPIPLGSWEGLFTGPRASHTHLTSTPHEPNSPVYRSSDPRSSSRGARGLAYVGAASYDHRGGDRRATCEVPHARTTLIMSDPPPSSRPLDRCCPNAAVCLRRPRRPLPCCLRVCVEPHVY
jgi:hypothetical protein